MKYEGKTHSGFSLQLADETWPEFVAIKDKVKDKLKRLNATGNIAMIDENGGYRSAKKQGLVPTRWFEKSENVFKPEKGKVYDRMSRTLGLAKQIAEEAVADLTQKSKVVVMGLDPSGDTASREFGSPWSRFSEGWTKGDSLPNGEIRRVRTNSEEGRYAKQRVIEFKKLGRKIGERMRAK